MSDEKILVYNPDASGTMASRFAGGERAKKWNKHVRSFPRKAADELVRLGGLYRAVTIDQAAEIFGVSADLLAARQWDDVTWSEYKAHDDTTDTPPERVVVLDPPTVKALVKASLDTAAKAAAPSTTAGATTTTSSN